MGLLRWNQVITAIATKMQTTPRRIDRTTFGWRRYFISQAIAQARRAVCSFWCVLQIIDDVCATVLALIWTRDIKNLNLIHQLGPPPLGRGDVCRNECRDWSLVIFVNNDIKRDFLFLPVRSFARLFAYTCVDFK